MCRPRNPALRTLQLAGYDVLALPRAGLAPGDVLFRRNGTLGRLGSFAGLPRAHARGDGAFDTRRERSAELESKAKAVLDTATGVSLAEGWARELGVQAAVQTALSGAHHLELAFEEVELCELTDAFRQLDPIAGDLDIVALQASPMLGDFVAGRGELFVLTEVLLSRSFEVTAYASATQKLDLAGKLPQQGGVSLRAQGGSVVTDTVRFSGLHPLGFAVKAWQLFVEAFRVRLVPQRNTQAQRFALTLDEEQEVFTLAPDELAAIPSVLPMP